MGSEDMAPPVEKEEEEKEAGVGNEEVNSKLGEDGVVVEKVVREDWSEALTKFIAERGGQSPKTFKEVGVDGQGLDTGSVEIVGSVAESMEESEPMGLESGVNGDVSADEVAVGESPLKSDVEAVDAQVEGVEEAGPSHDVEEKALGVDSGDVVLASEREENEDASPEISGEGLSENVDGEAVEEVVEGATNAEPEVEAVGLEFVATPSDDVEETGVEVNSEEANEVTTTMESGENGDASAEVPGEESPEKVDSEALDAPVEDVEDVVAEAEPIEELLELEAVPSPTDNAEEKAIEVNSGDGSEVTEGAVNESEEASPEVPAEESPDNVDSEALAAPVEEIGDVEITATIADEEAASQEEANPKTSEEEQPEGINAQVPDNASVEIVAESMEESEPSEAIDSHVEEVEEAAPSHDAEEKSLEVDSRDFNEEFTVLPPESGDNEDASPESPAEESSENVDGEAAEEVVEATTNAEPDVESAALESVSTPSVDVEDAVVDLNSEEVSEVAAPEKADSEAPDARGEDVEEVVEETTSAEPNEELSEPEAVSAPSDNVEEKSIEVNPGDVSEGADIEEASPETPAEESPDKVDSEALDAPVEEIGDVEDAATSAEPDVQSTSQEVEPQMPASEAEEETNTTTSTPLPAEEELFDLLRWESLDRTTSPDNSQGLPTEDPSDVSSERGEETVAAEDGVAQTERSVQVEELPQKSEAEPQSNPTDAEVNEEEVAEASDAQSVSGDEDLSEPPMISCTEDNFSVPIEHTSEDPSDALAEPCDKDPLTDELEHPTANASSIPSIIGSDAKELPNTDDDVACETIKSIGDVSHLLQTVMTDEEVKAAAIHYPEESVEVETQVLESDTAHEESEASGASQKNEVETAAREFILNDFSEAPITSEVEERSGDEVASHVVTPYLATAVAAASSESDEVAPKSYNLDEVATNLHDAAAKTSEDAEASDVGKKQSSVAKSVAQIVLEESSKAKDSSEYISGVVQHVAQFAQDAGQSDPNVLPDTVARVFDGETAASPANQVTQPKETTSLGTMVSLFVIWCVSLCASRVSSKDMPAPALKLAAEEVAAVLHSNAPSQPTPAQENGTSSH